MLCTVYTNIICSLPCVYMHTLHINAQFLHVVVVIASPQKRLKRLQLSMLTGLQQSKYKEKWNGKPYHASIWAQICNEVEVCTVNDTANFKYTIYFLTQLTKRVGSNISHILSSKPQICACFYSLAMRRWMQMFQFFNSLLSESISRHTQSMAESH